MYPSKAYLTPLEPLCDGGSPAPAPESALPREGHSVKDLSIELDFEDQLDALSSTLGLTQSMDELEVLSIDILKISEAKRNQHIRYPILTASKLHTLTLNIPGFRLHDLSKIEFPWAQLTYLCLKDQITLRAWHCIIRACPLLQTCYVGFRHDIEEDNKTMEAETERLDLVTMNHLQDLNVGFFTPFSAAVFTGITHMAALKNMTVISRKASDGFRRGVQPLAFYKQRAHLLQRLNLQRQSINAADVLEILRLAPLLTKLTLDCEGDHDGLLNALIVPPPKSILNASILVPKLGYFCLMIIDHDRSASVRPSFSVNTYVQAIRSRQLRLESVPENDPTAHGRFEAVLIVNDRTLQEIDKQLTVLRGDGLDLLLKGELEDWIENIITDLSLE